MIYVDYPTQRRITKASASWYADVIARNGLASVDETESLK
jgi:beta-glucosidase